MIDLLRKLLHGILDIPFLVADFLVDAFNLIIAGIAALAALVLGLLPSFPDAPDPPDSGVLGWLAWIAPIGTIVAGFALFVTCWIGFLVIRVALRWVKAL
jgi:hypothetical protein